MFATETCPGSAPSFAFEMRNQPLEKSWPELVASLVKQSGIAVVFAGVIGAALNRVYSDLGERNRELVFLVRDQVRESRAVTNALVSVSESIDRNFEAIRENSREKVNRP